MGSDLLGALAGLVYRPKPFFFTLGLQIAQSRSYLYTLRPKVCIVYILGAMGLVGVHIVGVQVLLVAQEVPRVAELWHWSLRCHQPR